MPKGANVMSQADIADRLTILALKAEHGLKGADVEAMELIPFCRVSSADMTKLYRANQQGWEANDHITEHVEGRRVLPDSEVVAWVRKAHLNNKERVALKNHISRLFSQFEERKTWE